MFGKRKKLQGMELISEVTGRFVTMVENLETGIKDCLEERDGVKIKIAELTHRSIALDTAANRAGSLVKNLETLMGE